MLLYILSLVLLIDALPPGYPDSKEHGSRPTIRSLPDGSTEYKLLIVTDMDKDSRAGEWTWRAVTREGLLTLSPDMTHVSITWDEKSERNLTSSMNIKGRAMELSDLSVFHNRILTPDDRTGLISEIKNNKMIPWVFLNSGPGNTTSPFKCEWMTIKDDVLYVGGHGNVFRNREGKIVHQNNMWIKTVTPEGEVTNVDWTDVYNNARNAVGISEPGYLTHEAVQWSETQGHWYFLPRKESKTVYVEEEDETKGTDLLIIGNPDLDQFEVKRVGILRPERGYSAFDFIPGTDDKIIVALKSKEVTDEPVETYITVFTTDGQVLLDDQKLDGNYKFEGLHFI
uniref:Calcium-dependent apyrase n=1 Tax=Ostertagia ostertagi TaxID=6317 RepID=D6PAH2_OSTOS|nr:calcium-dependent apyrase [Ostertagia ostertagi]